MNDEQIQKRFQSMVQESSQRPLEGNRVSLETVASTPDKKVAFPAMTGPEADNDARTYASTKERFQAKLAEQTQGQSQDQDEGKGKGEREIGKDAELARSINGVSRDPNRNRPSF
jgi:hypothetical protein